MSASVFLQRQEVILEVLDAVCGAEARISMHMKHETWPWITNAILGA